MAEKQDNSATIWLVLGFVVGLIPWGLGLIGVTVNIWLGGAILALAFMLVTYAFWIWERTSRFHIALRISTICVAALIYFGLVGRQMIAEYRIEHSKPEKPQTPASSATALPSEPNTTTPPSPSAGPISGSDIKKAGEAAQVHIANPKAVTSLPPIEVSLDCHFGTMPIVVPAGNVAYIFAPNKNRKKVSRYHVFNTEGISPKIWPSGFDPEEHRYDPGIYSKCGVTNHGKNDLLELVLPFQAEFASSGLRPTDISFNPLDSGKTISFYILNNCPISMNVQVPLYGFARPVGERKLRGFQLELPEPGQAGINFDPSKVNWTQEACEEQSQPAKPAVATIRIASQERITSTDANLPFGIKVVLQTDNPLQPISFTVTFDGPVGHGEVSVAGGGVFISKSTWGYKNRPEVFGFSWDSPRFSPDRPIILKAFSQNEVHAIEVKSVEKPF